MLFRSVIFLSDKYHESESAQAARRMFQMASVDCIPFKANGERLIIDFQAEAAQARRI